MRQTAHVIVSLLASVSAAACAQSEAPDADGEAAHHARLMVWSCGRDMVYQVPSETRSCPTGGVDESWERDCDRDGKRSGLPELRNRTCDLYPAEGDFVTYEAFDGAETRGREIAGDMYVLVGADAVFENQPPVAPVRSVLDNDESVWLSVPPCPGKKNAQYYDIQHLGSACGGQNDLKPVAYYRDCDSDGRPNLREDSAVRFDLCPGATLPQGVTAKGSKGISVTAGLTGSVPPSDAFVAVASATTSGDDDDRTPSPTRPMRRSVAAR
jgi:hypothetical protein